MRVSIQLLTYFFCSSVLGSGTVAQTCATLLPLHLDLSALSEAEKLRLQSTAIAERLAYRDVDDIIVVGEFSRLHEEPFGHITTLEEIREVFVLRNRPDLQTPWSITYSYFSAFAFDGQQLLGGELQPFISDGLDYDVTMQIDHVLLVDQPIITDRQVIGVLRSGSPLIDRYIIQSHYCGAYYTIDQIQLDDLVACYREDDCE